MPRKKKIIAKPRLGQFLKQIAIFEKRANNRISNLQRDKQRLQKQIDEINKELSLKVKKGAQRTAGGKKGRRERAKVRLPAGVLHKALVDILTRAKAPMSPKDLEEAIKAKKVYKKGPPATLNKIIAQELRRKEFKKVSKGKYVVREKAKGKPRKAKAKPQKKAKVAAKKVLQKKAKGKVKKEQAKVAAKKEPQKKAKGKVRKEKAKKEEKGKAKEEKKEEEKEKGE